RQRASNNQGWFNESLGVGDDTSVERMMRRRADATAAFTQELREMQMAEDAAFAHNSQVDVFIRQLQNMAQAAGKTHYEMLELRAAQLGVSGQAGGLINQIRAQNEAMGAGTL